LAVRENIEGVTFLGGEPMEQADCLAVIAQAAQTVGLSIITFTGRKYEDLLAENRPGVLRLLSLTDILIDGEFQKDAPEDTRPLVGSQNQRFIFLTNRYCESDIAQMRNAFEVRIDETGRFQINGMGDIRKLQTYLNQYRG
jgi:anaerobic ribonucleoside-triphosphate reductase activating protein